MNIGDVAQIRLAGRWGDVDINLNVFHAFSLEAELDLLALLVQLAGALVTEVQGLFFSTTMIDTLDAVNLFDKAETANLFLGVTGTRAGIAEYLPSQTAVATRYIHDNAAIRYGYKRWWQGAEVDQANGVLLAARLPSYEAVSWAPMLDMLPQATYVIVKRIKEPFNGPGGYRLPENVGELEYGVVTDFDLNTRLSSQNSRKCPPI